jgi:hypothetical protein
MKKLLLIALLLVSALIAAPQAQAATTVTFGSSAKMFAPNCFCKEDVVPYNLATYCGPMNSCNGATGTQTVNVASGNYRVKVNVGSLTASQKYEVAIVTVNGKDYTVPDLGGNATSTKTAVYDLGIINLSGNVTFKARHKYANIFTGKWYTESYNKVGSGDAMESIIINSIVLDKINPVIPAPTCAINANPATINAGSQSTLTWSSTNATSFSINQGVGSVNVSGTRIVRPTQTTLYTATAKGVGGSVTCSTRVQVNVLHPAITIIKNDNDNGDDTQTVTNGGSATFKITVTNTGNAILKNVVISDPRVSNCNRSASQTKNLYAGDYFDPKESFNYTCTDSSVTASYINIAQVTASPVNNTANLTDSDNSSVRLENTPPLPPPPGPGPKPEDDECKGEIGDYVWLDANGDGVQDDSEKGLSGIRVKITSDGNTYRTTTDHKGYYSFKRLCKNDYIINVTNEDVDKYTQTYDPDDTKNNKTDVTLKNDHDSYMKADFGYKGKRVAPATGSGSIAIYLAALLSITALLIYIWIKTKKLAYQK